MSINRLLRNFLIVMTVGWLVAVFYPQVTPHRFGMLDATFKVTSIGLVMVVVWLLLNRISGDIRTFSTSLLRRVAARIEPVKNWVTGVSLLGLATYVFVTAYTITWKLQYLDHPCYVTACHYRGRNQTLNDLHEIGLVERFYVAIMAILGLALIIALWLAVADRFKTSGTACESDDCCRCRCHQATTVAN
jgi:hypothetical protein